jgi:hypothetical protein
MYLKRSIVPDQLYNFERGSSHYQRIGISAGAPRIWMSMSRDGLLPKDLEKCIQDFTLHFLLL